MTDVKIKTIRFLAFILITSFGLIGCGEEKSSEKSIEQIHAEEGIPVNIEVVDYQLFEKHLSFYSNLSGIKEATKGAMVGGRILRVNSKPGDNVKENKIIVEFAYDNPGIAYEQAKTAFENSKKNYERMKALLTAGETSQANFDGAETQYLVDKRNFETQKQLIHIDAPFDGIITDVKVKAGDNVKGEAPLFTIAQLHKMRTKLWVSEQEINLIKVGMSASINYLGKEYKGRIVEISLSADPYKQAFAVEVEFDNSKRELKSGPAIEVKLLTYSNPNAIVISRNLVKKDEKGMYVFVVNGDKAEKRYISNGMDSGLEYEVSSGLKIGDKLIVSGTTNLEAGKKIKIIN